MLYTPPTPYVKLSNHTEITQLKKNEGQDPTTMNIEEALKKGYFDQSSKTINKTQQQIIESINNDPLKALEELLRELTVNNNTTYKMESNIAENEEDGRLIVYKVITLDDQTPYQYVTLYYDFPEKHTFKIDIIPYDPAQPAFSFIADGDLPKEVTPRELLRFIKTNISCVRPSQ